MDMFSGTPHEQFFVIVDLIGTVTSSIASVITVMIISKMNLTGYLKLILTMTWFQLVYDVSFFNATVNTYYWLDYVANVWQLIGGVGSSLISNWIAFVVLYIVSRKRSVDILGNYNAMLASALIPGVAIAILYTYASIPMNAHPDLSNLANVGLYYYTRLISIFLNFLMFGLASYFNHRIRSKGLSKTPAEIAINTLCRRLMYYPLLQAVSRSGFAWYEFQWGFDFAVSSCTGNPIRYTALMYATIITPTVSFGYLFLFIAIEPRGYESFLELFGYAAPRSKTIASLDATWTGGSGAGGLLGNQKTSTNPMVTSGEFDNRSGSIYEEGDGKVFSDAGGALQLEDDELTSEGGLSMSSQSDNKARPSRGWSASLSLFPGDTAAKKNSRASSAGGESQNNMTHTSNNTRSSNAFAPRDTLKFYDTGSVGGGSWMMGPNSIFWGKSVAGAAAIEDLMGEPADERSEEELFGSINTNEHISITSRPSFAVVNPVLGRESTARASSHQTLDRKNTNASTASDASTSRSSLSSRLFGMISMRPMGGATADPSTGSRHEDLSA